MGSSNGNRSLRKHRPLPSVKVALLPHERRAVRARYVAFATVAGLLVAAGLAVAFGRDVWHALQDEGTQDDDAPWPSEQTDKGENDVLVATAAAPEGSQAFESPEPAAPEPGDGDEAQPALVTAAETVDEPEAEPTAPSHVLGTTEHEFGKARGFRDALIQSGASDEQEADRLVAALQDLLDFRRCRPEHKLRFQRGPGGDLERFEYHASLTDVYRAERQADGALRGYKVEVPIERRRVAKGGYISGSLGHALVSLDLGRSLASVFVEAFENRIDFKKQSRAGDSFRLLVDEEYIDGELLGYGDVEALEYSGEHVGTHHAYWFVADKGERGDFYDETGRAIHGGWLRTPLRYDHVSSEYDLRRRHPILKRIVPHRGIDYAASPGTPVWAAAKGVVSFAGYRGANGNLVSVRHDGGYETFYAHLSRIARGIKPGVEVSQRQVIGSVGSTGRSTGPHLHFGLKRRGRFVDPETQLNRPGKPLPTSQMGRFKAHARKLKQELTAIQLAAAPTPAQDEAGGDEAATSEVFHEEDLEL